MVEYFTPPTPSVDDLISNSVIKVSPDFTNDDTTNTYSTIGAALTRATTLTATMDRVGVEVLPGIYDEEGLELTDGVTLCGHPGVLVRGAAAPTAGTPIFILNSNCVLCDLQIVPQAANDGATSIIYVDHSTLFSITGIKATAGTNVGGWLSIIECDLAALDNYCYISNNNLLDTAGGCIHNIVINGNPTGLVPFIVTSYNLLACVVGYNLYFGDLGAVLGVSSYILENTIITAGAASSIYVGDNVSVQVMKGTITGDVVEGGAGSICYINANNSYYKAYAAGNDIELVGVIVPAGTNKQLLWDNTNDLIRTEATDLGCVSPQVLRVNDIGIEGGVSLLSFSTENYIKVNKGFGLTREAASATPYTADKESSYIGVTVAGACQVNLPASPFENQIIIIKDERGTAGAATITVAGNGRNIDGSASQTITTNYGALSVIYNGTEWSII